jgi:hypothetical protein
MATPAQRATEAKRDAALASRNPALAPSKQDAAMAGRNPALTPPPPPKTTPTPKPKPKPKPKPETKTPAPAPDAGAPVEEEKPKTDTGEGIRIANQYGISEALLNDPVYGAELSSVYALFKAENVGAALEALFKTSYYKNLNSTVSQRLNNKLSRPGVYANDLDAYTLTQRRRLVDLKIPEADLKAILQDAYDKGLTDNQVDNLLKFSTKVTGFGGETLGDVNSLKAFANSYGVGSLLNQAYWDTKAKSLFNGETTNTDIQEEIKTLSASSFPAYAEGIKKGIPLAAQASNVITTVANLLERDADTVTFDDPLVKRIMNWTNPTSGKQEVMPQYLVEKETKSTNDWLFTNNARNTIDNLTLKTFSDMGIV